MVDYRALFEQAPAAFLTLLPDEPRFTIVAATDSYLRATLTTRGGRHQIIGCGVFEAFPDRPDDPNATGTRNLLYSLREAARTKKAHRMAVQRYDIQAPDHSWEARWWEPLNTPVLDTNGDVKYILHYVEDVTARELQREATVAEHEARNEAELANQAKMHFLAAMSHELRTPLNAIAGYVDLIEMGIHGPVTEAQRGALLRVSANQRHLLTLISDILSFAKVEAGTLRLESRVVPARAILESMDALIGPQAHSKGIAYSVHMCDPTLAVRGDPERIRQILLNLVGNAVKFTPTGGWIVLACDPAGEEVRFRVQDNGVGISPQDQEVIFSPFVQLDRKLSQPKEGVGLGLAISRDLAVAMGGDIVVDSSPGRGSTFWVVLPAAGPEAPLRYEVAGAATLTDSVRDDQL